MVCVSTPHTGQAFCKPVIPCLPGRFDASAGADLPPRRCDDCPAGYYQIRSDDWLCLECAAGRYQKKNGSSACTSCEAGRYQQSTKQLSCSLCGAGSVTDTLTAAGAITCTACSKGRYSSHTTIQCVDCSAGRYGGMEGASSVSACTACSKGRYAAVFGSSDASACLVCPAGKFSRSGQAFCESIISCAPGTYDISNNTEEKIDMAVARCVLCPHGRFQFAQDQPSCYPCPTGKYQNRAGKSHDHDPSYGDHISLSSNHKCKYTATHYTCDCCCFCDSQAARSVQKLLQQTSTFVA